MSELGPLRLIVNRLALGRAGREALSALRPALERREVAHDVVSVSGHAAAADAARGALDEGVGYLAAVGGDGTSHAILNGIADPDRGVPEEAVLAAISADHGGDFARTIGMRLPPERLATRLSSPDTMGVDVGVAEFTVPGGGLERRLFLNCARVGYGGEVTRRAARLPRRMGRFRHLLAAWAGIRATERRQVRVELAHAGRKTDLVELVVANGQFHSGGMRVAPRALPDDGRFSVLAFTGQPNQVFMLTTAMFQGQHLPSPEISEWQSPSAGVESDAALRVEADGEPLGVTPARFWLLEKALRIKI